LYFYNNPEVNNPQLAKPAIEYRFSSANFYENGVDEFGILTHIEEFHN
jgi:putative transposase